MRALLRPFPLAAVLLAGIASADDLLVCESNFHTVLRIDSKTGDIADPVFLNLNQSTGTAPQTPIAAVPMGDEVWITDRDAGVIFRFARTGAYLGEIGTPGVARTAMLRFDDEVWVAAPHTLERYDQTGALLATYDTSANTDPRGLLVVDGELLVSDADGNDIDVYDLGGNYLRTFHDSDGVTGIDGPELLSRRVLSMNVLAAGTADPAGMYELDLSGAQKRYVDLALHGLAPPHAVQELEDQRFLVTNDDGIWIYDAALDQVTPVFTGVVAWHVAWLDPLPYEVYCDENVNPNNQSDIWLDTVESGASSMLMWLGNGPAHQFTYIVVGDGNAVIHQPPGNKGSLCIAGGQCLGRFDKDVGGTHADGTYSKDLQAMISEPCKGNFVIQPGSTWNFQWWHRQPMGTPSSFSAALRVTFR